MTRGSILVILTAGLPPGTLLMLASQRRAPRGDPPMVSRIERWAAIALALGATALLAIGASLFAAPGTTRSWWPWPLTELTARMVGAWVAAGGVTLVAALIERDWTRALARYPDTADWNDAAAWIYVAACTALLALAAQGFRPGALVVDRDRLRANRSKTG